MVRLFFLLSYCFLLQVACAAPIQYGTLGQEQLHAKFAQAIKCSPQDARPVGYIYFSKEHPIDEATYYYAKEALEYFKKEKVCFVVVDLNCYGGALFPAIKIAELFQKFDINQKIPLIAYINNYAIGSGAMLAYACRFIAVNEHSYMGGQLPEQKIKIQSTPEHLMPYILNEYSSLAISYGRDPIIAEAMADIKLIVVERQGKLTGFYSRLDIQADSNAPDKILATDTEWLSLSARQLIQYGIAEVYIPSEPFKVYEGELFSELPLAKEPYLKRFDQAKLLVYSSFLINILLFLSKPIVAAMLLSAIVVFLYLQIKTARLNKVTLALLGLVGVMIIASLGIQALSWIELLFLCLGLTIVFLDSMLAESSISICVFGCLLVVFSLLMMLLPGFEKFSLLDFEAFTFAAGSLASRVIYLISGIIFACGVILYLEKTRFKVAKKIAKIQEDEKESTELPDLAEKPGLLPSIGSRGVAHSSLRPFGKVLIEDRIYDAISLDDVPILKKKKVEVVSLDDGRLVVKELGD